MKVSVLQGEMDVQRVICEESPACMDCDKETKGCAKLYRSAGSLESVCVEM